MITRRLSRPVVPLLLVIAVALAQLNPNLAQAYQMLATYNLTGVDPTYGQYYGEIWATSYISQTGCCFSQKLQAGNQNILFDATRASNLRTYLAPGSIAAVFHAFDYSQQGWNGQTNCAAPFNFNGWWWSNMPNTWPYPKNATCPFGYPNSGYNNELRVLMPASAVLSYNYYTGGGEFTVGYGTSYSGIVKMANDMYFIYSNGSEVKDNIPGSTWCSSYGGPEYRC